MLLTFDGLCSDSEVFIRLERIISLSRNRIVDGITNGDNIASQQESLAKEYYTLCNAQHGLSFDDVSSAAEEQAFAAFEQAREFRRDIKSSATRHVEDMAMMVKDRASKEPLVGKCDAIFVVTVGDALGTPEKDEGAALVKDFRALNLVQVADSSEESAHTAKVDDAVAKLNAISNLLFPASSNRKSPRLNNPESSLSSRSPTAKKNDKDYLSNPLVVSCTESLHIPSGLKVPNQTQIHAEPSRLMLPTMVIEYKKTDTTPMTALNQGRTYCVSAVTFLAALGIRAYPVFGLVTSGKEGSVIVAWHGKEEKEPVSCALFMTIQRRD
jgi:hypothetical protein